jgi:hypothetical protein
MFEKLFYGNGLINVFLESRVPLSFTLGALTKTISQLIQNQLFDWVVREFVRLTQRAEFADDVNFLALCRYLNPVCFNECGEWKISESRSVQIGRLVS